MDIDQWRDEKLHAVADLRNANQEWKKGQRKGLRSWLESARYRIRNLKSRTEAQIAQLKGEANQGGKSDDGDKDAGRQSKHVKDLLGDTGRVDNEAETDDSS